MAVIITQSLLNSDSEPEYPFNHARIGYVNYGKSANWAASAEESDHPAAALANEMTVRRWRATSNEADVTASFSTKSLNYVGLAAHNFEGALVTLEAEISGVFQQIASFQAQSNDAHMILFESVETNKVKLTIDGPEPPELGVMFVGKTLEMQRPFYAGHTPARLARTTVTRPRQSESGQYLSMTRRRRGYEGSASWKHLSDEWYRENFDPFVEHATERPFFFAWNPLQYPKDVIYAWTSDEIRPSYMGIRDLMQVGMSMRGYGD